MLTKANARAFRKWTLRRGRWLRAPLVTLVLLGGFAFIVVVSVLEVIRAGVWGFCEGVADSVVTLWDAIYSEVPDILPDYVLMATRKKEVD